MTENGSSVPRRGAGWLAAISVTFFALGLGMRSNRAFFEPVVQALASIIWSRRGTLKHYDPTQYEAYAVMALVLAGVFIVLSGFAWMFSASNRRGSEKGD